MFRRIRSPRGHFTASAWKLRTVGVALGAGGLLAAGLASQGRFNADAGVRECARDGAYVVQRTDSVAVVRKPERHPELQDHERVLGCRMSTGRRFTIGFQWKDGPDTAT